MKCPQINVNEACDSGNTALHAAVNSAKKEIVEILLGSKNLDINVVNKSCMNATALHLAVWHDSEEIAILLIKNKAFDLARENNNTFLLEIFDDLLKY